MRRKIPFSLLALLGILLAGAGLAGLWGMPNLCQYVYAPGSAPAGEILEKMEKAMEGAAEGVSLHATSDGVSLTAAGGGQGDVHLIQTAGSYTEIYPRAWRIGRPVSREDAAAGHRVIVLDEELAFRLFRDQDPLGQRVSILEKDYEVVGVACHRRRIGDRQELTAWIPLGVEDAPAAENMILSVPAGRGGSLRTLFENSARESAGDGSIWDLEKEKIRGTVLFQAVAMATGLWLLARWIRKLKVWTSGQIRQIREKARSRYPRQMAGYFILRALGMLAAWGAVIAAGAGIVLWASQLMLIFPEWVPENFLSSDSWIARFRSLTASFADPVQRRTAEIIEIRFWSGLIRWGITAALLGLLLRKNSRKGTETDSGIA